MKLLSKLSNCAAFPNFAPFVRLTVSQEITMLKNFAPRKRNFIWRSAHINCFRFPMFRDKLFRLYKTSATFMLCCLFVWCLLYFAECAILRNVNGNYILRNRSEKILYFAKKKFWYSAEKKFIYCGMTNFVLHQI